MHQLTPKQFGAVNRLIEEARRAADRMDNPADGEGTLIAIINGGKLLREAIARYDAERAAADLAAKAGLYEGYEQ